MLHAPREAARKRELEKLGLLTKYEPKYDKPAGAMYSGVPAWLIVDVFERNFASPKSASFAEAWSIGASASPTSSTLCVLTSRSAVRGAKVVGRWRAPSAAANAAHAHECTSA